ncbi:MAG TPA: peptidoglycan-binding domain-containing protein [Candidatus Binataceae bacterium]|nr:peptidoglycan-binding domain-containing protein [Candidatus Binataceae bacterium]
MRDLSLRMQGCDVGTWQQFLKSRSLYSGSVTGRFDDATERATREYQRRSRIDADGVVGAATVQQARRDGFVTPQDSGAGGDHFTLDPGVVLSSNARHTIRKIAENYYLRTCGTLEVHSGTRTPHKQAQAMWNNWYYERNRQIHYKDHTAEKEIHDTYFEGRRAGSSEKDTVEAMTHVIETQVRNGRYISLHLKGEAVDIRPNTNPPLQPKVLEEVVTELLGSGHCPAEEDNFHIQF